MKRNVPLVVAMFVTAEGGALIHWWRGPNGSRSWEEAVLITAAILLTFIIGFVWYHFREKKRPR